jgi:hypothetical protein
MSYNHALGHSKPVCSDGVTIDILPAIVSEVILHDAVTASGLIKSDVTGTVYILSRNRELEEVSNPQKVCRFVITLRFALLFDCLKYDNLVYNIISPKPINYHMSRAMPKPT